MKAPARISDEVRARGRALRLLALATTIVAGLGCAPDERKRFDAALDVAEPVLLATDFVPRIDSSARALNAELTLTEDLGPDAAAIARVVDELDIGDWTELEPGWWTAPARSGNLALGLRSGLPVALASETTRYEFIEVGSLVDALAAAVPGSFGVVGERIYLRLEEGQRPAEGLRFERAFSLGQVVDGAWQIQWSRFSCDGIPVLPGDDEVLDFDARPGDRLRFGLLAASLQMQADFDLNAPVFPYGDERGSVSGRVRARIELNDEPVFDEAFDVWTLGHLERFDVELPIDSSGPARLRLDVTGDPALTAFLTPTVVRAEDLAPERESEHPDVVLFLADTFRADSMAVYGGELGLTPTLDRFAADGRVFARARTPGSWTLPSQASMMSGLWPRQHGALQHTRALPGEVVTLAEHLADAGYRTGAITDGGLLSRRHQFEQGFEWFDERFRPFDQTLDEVDAFLAADDGRPIFLWVQTYRVHTPYRVSAATRAAHGERLGIVRSYSELNEMLRGHDGTPSIEPDGEPIAADEFESAVREVEALYRGGVIDFDAEFAEFIDICTHRGVLPYGHILFTSDHGEAFGEHGVMFHEKDVWEELLRIPMVLVGPGIEAAVVDHDATLVDVPRTLADMAGLEPAATWGGVSLLEAEGRRTTYAHDGGSHERNVVALIDGELKFVLEDDGQALDGAPFIAAFDLSSDPDERANIAAGDRLGELERRFAELQPAAREALRAHFSADAGRASVAAQQALLQLGYLELDDD